MGLSLEGPGLATGANPGGEDAHRTVEIDAVKYVSTEGT